jgi:hypothetical protein
MRPVRLSSGCQEPLPRSLFNLLPTPKALLIAIMRSANPSRIGHAKHPVHGKGPARRCAHTAPPLLAFWPQASKAALPRLSRTPLDPTGKPTSLPCPESSRRVISVLQGFRVDLPSAALKPVALRPFAVEAGFPAKTGLPSDLSSNGAVLFPYGSETIRRLMCLMLQT